MKIFILQIDGSHSYDSVASVKQWCLHLFPLNRRNTTIDLHETWLKNSNFWNVLSETFRFDIATGNSTIKTATRCNFINREPVWLFVFLGQKRKYTILLSGFYIVSMCILRFFHNSLPSVNTRSDKKTIYTICHSSDTILNTYIFYN